MPKTTKKTKKSKTPVPVIEVISIVDNPDGSSNLTYELNDEFVKTIGIAINKENPTEDDINDWLLDVLRKAADGEDGYEIVEVAKPKKKRKKKNG